MESESGQSTEDLTGSKMAFENQKNSWSPIALVALVLAVVAIVMATISLSQKGPTNVCAQDTGSTSGTTAGQC